MDEAKTATKRWMTPREGLRHALGCTVPAVWWTLPCFWRDQDSFLYWPMHLVAGFFWYLAATAWKRYLLVRRGKAVVYVATPGAVLSVPAAASIAAVGLLSVTAVGWGLLSLLILSRAVNGPNTEAFWFVAVAVATNIGLWWFVARCWASVGRDLRRAQAEKANAAAR